MHLEPAQRRFAVPGADAGSAADEQGVHARLLDIDPGPRYDPCCTRRGRNAVHTLADLWRLISHPYAGSALCTLATRHAHARACVRGPCDSLQHSLCRMRAILESHMHQAAL